VSCELSALAVPARRSSDSRNFPTDAKGPRGSPRPRRKRLCDIVGGRDIRRRLLLPLGAVEFQNRVERDFGHALLDGELLLVAVLLLVLARAKLSDRLNVRVLLQGSSEGREFSQGDRPAPVSAGLVIALVVLSGALGGE